MKRRKKIIKKYINPLNDYELTDGGHLCWLWGLLFGGFYFAWRGNWGWFFLYPIIVISSIGIGFFVLPFLVRKINRKYLLMKGFKEVEKLENTIKANEELKDE